MTPRFLIAFAPLLLPVSAATVQLSNGDFSTGTNPAATGWTSAAGGGTNSSPSNYAEAVPGSSWGRSMQIKSDGGNYIEQTLSLTDLGPMDAGSFWSFTVSLDYGYRRDAVTNSDHTLRISLWNLTDNIELAGQDLLIADPGVGANSLASGLFNLVYDNTSPSLAGDAIALRITSTSGDLGANSWQRTAMVDNVAVNAVPEPAAMLLGSLGLAGLLRRRR